MTQRGKHLELLNADGHTGLKIGIALASHDIVPVTFAYDLATLCTFSTAQLMANDAVTFGVNLIAGTYIHAARQEMMETLIREGATHALWLDTDMRFPKDALLRLLSRNVPLIGINYCKRGWTPQYVALKTIGSQGKRLVTGPDSTGIEEVEAIGFGLVLMDMRIAADLPAPPWFYFGQNEKEPGRWMGEDVTFCEVVRKAGHKVYVDHDLSKECKHTGTFEWRLEHAAEYLEQEAKS